MTRVFPDPAPAAISNAGLLLVTASACSLLRPLSNVSIVLVACVLDSSLIIVRFSLLIEGIHSP